MVRDYGRARSPQPPTMEPASAGVAAKAVLSRASSSAPSAPGPNVGDSAK